MENAPPTPENRTETDKDKDPKKKTRRKEIGLVAMERRRAPEANLLHSAQSPEHIGHMLVTAESKALEAAEFPEEKVAAQRIETLSRAELLTLSEKIIIDGSSLRQIYETHLIGERGLRRLIGEHLRGGDIKKALRMEITERELDFERDPALRDMAVGIPYATSKGKLAKTSLNKLLEQASVQLADTTEEAAFYKARADYETKQLELQQKQRRLIDIVFALTILILLIFVIWLVMTRR